MDGTSLTIHIPALQAYLWPPLIFTPSLVPMQTPPSMVIPEEMLSK